MEHLIENFVSHPVFYIGVVASFLAAIGFLVFLRGFIGGIGNVFTLSSNVDHVAHANTRTMRGVFILTSVFIVWEILRWNPFLVIALLIVWLFVYIIFFAE